MDLPDDWYIEHDGQPLVLDADKVKAEIERLRAALKPFADRASADGVMKFAAELAVPDHDSVSGLLKDCANAAIALVEQTGDKK